MIDSVAFPKMISRRHAVIGVKPDSGEWFVRDEGSLNGVYVDGVRVKEAVLQLQYYIFCQWLTHHTYRM